MRERKTIKMVFTGGMSVLAAALISGCETTGGYYTQRYREPAMGFMQEVNAALTPLAVDKAARAGNYKQARKLQALGALNGVLQNANSRW
jgi:hypothetical protein